VLDAQLALEWGLVNQIVEDAELADTAAALAARLAAGPAGAYGAVKRLLAESEPGWEAQLAREGRSIAERAETPEGREGIAAFLEKRTPKFT
jgi:2-(1,2-epoxy-1,2-dihydrophenyl)acetyl-CoA isomerase